MPCPRVSCGGCARRTPEARIAEMRKAGMPIESRSERVAGGSTATVYTFGTPELVRAMRLVFGTPGSSKLVM